MVATALRPRTVTEIVDAAFQVLRAHYGKFVMCSAIAYMPWLVLELIFIGEPDFTNLPSTGSFFIIGVGIWVTYALMSAVIIACASRAYLGDEVDVAAAVRQVVPRLHRIMIAATARYLAVVLGVITLLIASLYFVAKYFALTPVIVLEDADIRTAFKRTSDLSLGRKWHILNTLGLVGIIYWVLAIGAAMLGALPGVFIIQTIIGAVFTILAYPVIAITEALLYYDARIRSEGLDIEMMAGELGNAPTEATNP
jgi:hypothetical protein